MRVACLDLPALPLQLVWRAEPAWRAHPVVVIDDDRPQGAVLWACERARSAGVMIGQRYAHALSLCSSLRARVVPAETISEAIAEIAAALHLLSPRVEPGEPGTFWLDGEGLERVFPDPEGARSFGSAWGAGIKRAITELGFRGAIVIGYSRFATYAIARAMPRGGIAVLPDDAEERTAARAVPLARLEIDPKLRDALSRLGVTTVGQMVRLPGGGILERFGREAYRLYQLAAEERWDPLVPAAPPEAPDERVLFDDDEADVERLVFASKAPIERLLARLAARGRAVTALHLELTLKHAVGNVELRADCIKPAAATLDGRALLRLVHLRLTGMPPVAPVNAVRVWADDVLATREQLALFASRPRRDLRAADEALARVRAELGDDAVVRAVVRDGHLPEARFGWQRLVHAVAAQPAAAGKLVMPLIRRVMTKPQSLPPQVRQVRDDGWLLSGLEHGAVVRIAGPYIISGGWWNHELHREYHFAELRRGDCLWVYYDRHRRRWFWQGAVE
ncbi:MAG: DNA polymerase Y family protein [Kofleriaceae bacterium]